MRDGSSGRARSAAPIADTRPANTAAWQFAIRLCERGCDSRRARWRPESPGFDLVHETEVEPNAMKNAVSQVSSEHGNCRNRRSTTSGPSSFSIYAQHIDTTHDASSSLEYPTTMACHRSRGVRADRRSSDTPRAVRRRSSARSARATDALHGREGSASAAEGRFVRTCGSGRVADATSPRFLTADGAFLRKQEQVTHLGSCRVLELGPSLER